MTRDFQAARRYLVRGRVQDVAYRDFARRMADALGVTGYVRNLDDGRVEVYAVGAPDKLSALRAALRKGPHLSDVRGVDEREAAAQHYSDFQIIRQHPDRESCELLCAIVRRPADARQIDRLAGSVRDWDSLVTLAREHRVLPLLFSRLADLGSAVPPAAQERLRAEYQREAARNLANASELIGLLKAFHHEGIPAMPFKGVVLGASIYGDLTTRPAGDLDVLIHYRHLLRATAVLLQMGYELKTPVHPDGTPAAPRCSEYQFTRQADGMVVEVRWRLDLAGGFRRNLGMDWVWQWRRTAMLAGAEVPNLSPEITLLVLCMHGSKHSWSRLIWICDVAQLLAAFPGLDWTEITQEAKRVGLWRTLALGVLLARRVAGAAVPQAVLHSFESDTTACSLAGHFQQTLFDWPLCPPPGRIPYAILLLGFHDRVRLLLSLDRWRPNEKDRAAVHLPQSLEALYYLVHPVRLLWDRLAR